MFEPYLKSFYIHSSDPTNVRLLKVMSHSHTPILSYSIPPHFHSLIYPQLDIIANIAGESSIHTILREFRVRKNGIQELEL